MSEKPRIGCLALQGCVERHRPHIEAAGAEFRTVKTAKHFEEINAFILPGGESTTMLKLIDRFNLWDVLAQQFAQKPVWGICAGSILIAQRVTDPEQKSFGILPITVKRNGYGRQLESRYTDIKGYEIALIRAPIITEISDDVDVLAQYEGSPVWVKKGKDMATTFHPELTFNFPSPMHTAFVELVKAHKSHNVEKREA